MSVKITKRKSVQRRRAAAGMARRRRRLPSNVPEIASCSDGIKLAMGETNQMYGSSTVQLSLFDRATLISKAYQEYRITSVRFTFRPQFDTFTANTDAGTAIRVPQLYYMIDKAQSIPIGATIDTLRSMGARPKRFDDKNIVVKYAPGVQQSVWTGGAATAPSAPRVSPWLSTNATPDGAWNPSGVDHGGLFYILDTQGPLPGDGQYEYGVEVECQFQFRKPLISVPTGEVSAAKDPFADRRT